MKEIKFRAYDTVKNEWLDQGELIFTHGLWFQNFRALVDYAPLDVDSGNVKILQYTGIKDESFKEVYEGDIIEIKYYEYGKERIYIGVVRFAMRKFYLEGVNEYYGINKCLENNCKILGNIYEKISKKN